MFGVRGFGALACAAMLGLAACGGDVSHDVVIRVVSDLVAGPEAALAEVTLGERAGVVVRTVRADLRFTEPLVRGRELAFLTSVKPGEYRLEARAMPRADADRAMRSR